MGRSPDEGDGHVRQWEQHDGQGGNASRNATLTGEGKAVPRIPRLDGVCPEAARSRLGSGEGAVGRFITPVCRWRQGGHAEGRETRADAVVMPR